MRRVRCSASPRGAITACLCRTCPGRGRTLLIPRLDDTVEWGTQTVLLAGAEYADGRIEHDGVLYLKDIRREWQTPVWTFDLGGSVLEKRIVAPHGQNTVYVQYRCLNGSMRAAPAAIRDVPDARREAGRRPDGCIPSDDQQRTVRDSSAARRAKSQTVCAASEGRLCCREVISEDVSYRVDRDRGSEHIQDLFSPGYFTVDLSDGQSVALVASVEPWDMLDIDCDEILQAEQRRLEQLVSLASDLQKDDFAKQLQLAADQFIVQPGARPEEQALAQASGDQARTIIAGYHWFGDWGRDTMISLEGLTLSTGRPQETRAILRTFARYIRDGLLPNLFPEGSRQALYHTADATLWYFHALDRYLTASQDRDTLMQLYPTLKEVIHRHRQGTKFNIGVDPKDGLLQAGAPGYQLTWMDAKVDDWVVTPRRGKPVEIQALWYNALCLMAEWAGQLGDTPAPWREMAEQAEASFHRRYWFAEGGHLYDVVDGEDGDDPSLRPNQIFSLSLRFPILREERWRPVVDVVSEKLLTPFGLRTLSPDHPDYKRTYAGDLRARDAAYHQGTVWPWLLGHYIDARLKVYRDKAEARSLLRAFADHLARRRYRDDQ